MNNRSSFVKKVVDSILDEQHYAFETIFRDRLTQFIESLELLLDDIDLPFSNRFSLVKRAGGTTLHSAAEIAIRALLDLLYHHQEELVGETPEARYNDFVQRFVENRLDELFPSGSELRILIEQKFSSNYRAIRELLERFKHDCTEISTQFGLPFRSIESFSMGQGDTHNDGRAVCVVSINDNEKIVYKPHSLQNDIIWARILHWFSSKAELKTDMRHMKVIERGDYGWQSYVHAEPCEGKEQVTRYMYRIGALLFISYVTGFNDLHLENIIACGEYPIVIDTETLFSNRSSFEKIDQDNASPLSKVLNNSVFSTLLLPTDFLRGGETAQRIDTSGLLGGLEQRKPKALHLINLGRDDISFDDGEIDEIAADEGVARFEGERLNPADYIEDIIKGFQDAYHCALKNRESFCELLNEACFSKGVFRQLMRDTELYHRYLQASYHPAYAKDRATREMVYRRLKGKGGYLNLNHQRLVNSEVEQLLNNDIPCFFTGYDCLDLFPPYGESIPGFFAMTAHEQTTEKLRSLSEKDKWLQSYFIRCAMIKDPFRPEEGNCTAIMDPLPADLTRQEQIKAVSEQVYRIREQSRISDTTGRTLGYINVDHHELNGRFKTEDHGLYEGSGAALFYLQMYRIYGEEYLDSAKRMVEHSLSGLLAGSDALEHIGLFTGAGSYLYLCLQAYRVFREESYLDRMNGLCEKMLASALPMEEETDVIAGYSGNIIFCLNAYHSDPTLVNLRNLAIRYGKSLFEACQKDRIRFQNGFSHGYAGSSLALFMLAKETGCREYYDAAAELLKRERTLYVPETNQWIDVRFQTPGLENWCYGAGGILVARMLSLNYVEPAEKSALEEEISRCLDILLEKTSVSMPTILCHGIAGNLDILLWYLQQREDEWVRAFVNEQTDQMLQQMITRGVVTESAPGILDISFMTGISGMSYYLLRCLDPSIPCVLALETM